MAGVLGRRAAAEQQQRPEALLGEFRLGEERVRHIVLGSPLAPQLATTPPAWARYDCLGRQPQELPNMQRLPCHILE